MARFEMTAEPMALRFAFLAGGYGLCAFLADPVNPGAPGPRDLPEPTGAEVPRAASSRLPSLPPVPDAWHRPLAHATYLIRPRYPLLAMILRLTGGYEILAPAGGSAERIVFDVTEEGGPVPGILRVQGVLPDDGELMVIHRRRWPLAKRQVTVTAGGKVLAVIRTGGVGEAGWTIEDGSGAVLGEVVQVLLLPRLATYEIRVRGTPACRVVWTLKGLLRPELEITFLEAATARLDKRLGLALGLILEGHGRFATHVVSN